MSVEPIDNRGMEILAVAIVKQAVEDYIKALKKNNIKQIKECEDFFNSEWCRTLTGINPEYLVRKIKENVDKMEVGKNMAYSFTHNR